jgi:SAM-dependent methyltransferase
MGQDRSVSSGVAYYNECYFEKQRSIGEIGGWANLPKFAPFVQPGFRVLDFGCGGGYLLERLHCREKQGIEVNPAARAEARKRNIETVGATSEVPDEWADIIVSHHALEHCLEPLPELRALRSKLIPGGRAVFVVPCESIRFKYKPGDVTRHLYTWSPQSLGNLFNEAGYTVESCEPFIHIWPPRIYALIAHRAGKRAFHLCCKIYGFLTYLGVSPSVVSEVRVVARRDPVCGKQAA